MHYRYIIISTHSTRPTDPRHHAALAGSHSSAAAALHFHLHTHTPAARTSAAAPKAVVQAEAAEGHSREVTGPVLDFAIACRRFGGFEKIGFGAEAVRYIGVVRSFVAVGRIVFVWVVVRWVGLVGRSFGYSEGIVFVLRVRREVVRGLGGGSCPDCSHPGFEVVVFAAGRRCRSAVTGTVVEEGIGFHFGRKQDDLIGQKIENVVVVRSELDIGQSSSWSGILQWAKQIDAIGMISIAREMVSQVKWKDPSTSAP